jgi:hypothetical protein
MYKKLSMRKKILQTFTSPQEWWKYIQVQRSKQNYNESWLKQEVKLDMKEGENDVYKMIKLRERKTSDFNQVKYIKNEFNSLLMKDHTKKRCKKKYFWQVIQWKEWENHNRVGRLVWWHQQAICSKNLRDEDEKNFKNDENE